MALMPGAEYVGPIPSTNYSTNGAPKIGTATHDVEGSASSALGEFRTSGVKLSAHFIVAGPNDAWPDGHILQVLDTDLAAYAQAAGNYPPTSYIAIEFAGYTTTPMSAAQMASGARIDAWASGVHHFPLVGPVAHGQPGCTTHCNPDGTPDPNWGNHPCPGPIRLAQVPQMVAMAVALVTPPAPQTQGADMAYQCTDPTTGGTWSTDANGALYAEFGAPFVEGLNQHPEYHAGSAESGGANPCVGIAACKDGTGAWGIVYFTNNGQKAPDGSPYHTYRFARSGQPD